MSSDDENQPGADELREAEALAAALEGRAAGTSAPLPADALETAALLRHARGEAPLPADLEARVADRVLSDLGVRRATRRRGLGLLVATSVLVPAAAVMIAVFSLSMHAPPRPRFTPPAPPADLLRAQAAAARGDGQALAALDQEMRAYRRQYYEGLRRRAGGRR